jgi:UDP-N-acetylglucosamine 2-epimerase (non-hydrolysing)
VLSVRDRLASGALKPDSSATLFSALDPRKKLVLVTAHRRESFGPGFEGICEALVRVASRGDAEILYPVHPNPNVRAVVERRLQGVEGIHLIEPLAYVPFVAAMSRAHILLTDSGGIQEEGPSLGKPVLVMRDKTERPEAVHAGTAILVGTNPDVIVRETTRLLDDPAEYERRARIHNPYGDGRASARIHDAVAAYFATS